MHDASTETTNASTLEELATLCENRTATYGFLARLYRSEASEELLSELRATRFPASTGNESMDAGYRLMATYLSNAWENSLEELAIDYMRTFIGNGIDALSAAYPFESVYTSEKRLMMQEARDEVLAIYRSYGMDKTSSWKEGEDHISLEMEFMQALSLRTARTLREGNEEAAANLLETQRNFLSDHLAFWEPLFAADVAKHAQTGFYRGTALLTDGFIAVELAFLEEITEDAADAADADASVAATDGTEGSIDGSFDSSHAE